MVRPFVAGERGPCLCLSSLAPSPASKGTKKGTERETTDREKGRECSQWLSGDRYRVSLKKQVSGEARRKEARKTTDKRKSENSGQV